MVNIIKSDLFRLLKGKAIYIILIVAFILVFVNSISMQAGHIGLSTSTNSDINDVETMNEISNAKSLSEFRSIMKKNVAYQLDKQIIGQNINLYYLFIIIVAVVLTTDFSNSSIKNTLSSAISRKKYYFSKLLLIMGLSTILILFNNYINYFMNLIINGKDFSTPILEFTKLTIIQLPLLYGIISLLVSFSFLFRKTSIFNTISIPFILAVQLIIIGITSLFKIKADWFFDYEMQFALSKIVESSSTRYIVGCMVLGIAYILIFNLIGYFSFKKCEIK